MGILPSPVNRFVQPNVSATLSPPQSIMTKIDSCRTSNKQLKSKAGAEKLFICPYGGSVPISRETLACCRLRDSRVREIERSQTRKKNEGNWVNSVYATASSSQITRSYFLVSFTYICEGLKQVERRRLRGLDTERWSQAFWIGIVSLTHGFKAC